MKTLVIHPKDHSTDFLSVIYSDKKDWTIINDVKYSAKFLKEQIKNHDRIIMLGHGSPDGLLDMSNFHNIKYIIDSSFVYLLREKECVCIWCNADKFVEKYELKGFYTGMIISEYEEALMFCINPFGNMIDESNDLFANSVKNSIDKLDMLSEMKSTYIGENNPIILFNQNNLYNCNR